MSEFTKAFKARMNTITSGNSEPWTEMSKITICSNSQTCCCKHESTRTSGIQWNHKFDLL